MARNSLLGSARAAAIKLGYVRLVLVLLIILYAVGIAGHLYMPTQAFMLAMTPWFLLICGLLVALPSLVAAPRGQRSAGGRFFIWILATYLLTFFLEALGVATGLVFGAYVYGPVLGFGLFGVPLVIAFNWVLVVYGAQRLSERLFRPRLLQAVFTAALATGFDWIMEPLAIRLNYWRWAGAAIPLQNYLAWFIIAFVASLAYIFLVRGKTGGQHTASATAGARSAGTLAWSYMLIQAAFFAAIRLGWLAGLG